MTCSLRSPRQTDYEAIASWISDAAACARWAGPRVSFPFPPSDLERLLAMDGIASNSLVDETSAFCGFGQFWVTTPGAAHLGRIIVAPSQRGKGYGRLLCQQLIRRVMEETGATEITLRVYRDNIAACLLYSNLGLSVLDSKSTDDVLFMRAAVQHINLTPDRA